MSRNYFVLIATTLTLAFASITARAKDAGALLDLLVKKKIITNQEAEEVRGDLTREAAQTSGGKPKISQPINEIELYGDMRVGYEQRQGTTPEVMPGSPGPNDTLKRSRERYRLRFGICAISRVLKISIAPSSSLPKRRQDVYRGRTEIF